MTCPAPESLVPQALGTGDPATTAHVESCPTCQAEVARLREAAGLLRGPASLESLRETAACLDELALADFVDGRLTSEAREAAVAHLLTCARCRAVVRATVRLRSEAAVARDVPDRRWRRWSVPVGLAAAAAVLLVIRPWGVLETGGLREPPLTSAAAPVPIAPRAVVAEVGRLIWSSVPKADLYRVRVYDGDGTVVWRLETVDTTAALPTTVLLSPEHAYFWRVEAQVESNRWAASDLVEFRLTGPRR